MTICKDAVIDFRHCESLRGFVAIHKSQILEIHCKATNMRNDGLASVGVCCGSNLPKPTQILADCVLRFCLVMAQ